MVQVASVICTPIITFYTQVGTFPVVSRDSNLILNQEQYNAMNRGLLSFQTKNDESQDLPSASIVCDDSFPYNIVKPNDYVRIDVQYRNDTFGSGVQSTCLYAGLVSELRETVDSNSNARTYTITVQGVAKILKNFELSTFTEATQNAGYALLPDDEKTGIKFSGKSSAGIIYEVLKKFILGDAIDDTQINKLAIEARKDKDSDKDKDKNKEKEDEDKDGSGAIKINNLLYDYNTPNGTWKPKDILHVNIEENKDETYTLAEGDTAQQGLTKWSNYNGSLLSMIKDIAAKPFNEIFWSHESGRATLNYRPTPFDKENWEKLPIINLETNAILNQEIANNDQEQCAVFKLTAEEQAQSENFDAYLYPVTNIQLIQRYGYKKLSVASDYFSSNGQKHEGQEGVEGESQASKGEDSTAKYRYPLASQVNYVVNCIKSKNFDSSTVYIPSELGGDSYYNKVKSLLSSCSDQNSFVQQCQAIDPNIFKGSVAQQLWNFEKGANTHSTKNSTTTLTHAGYLSIVSPTTTAISPKNIGSFNNLKKGVANIKKHPKYSAEELMQLFNYNIGSKQAYEIAKSIGDGTFSPSKYQEIISKYKFSDAEDGVGTAGGSNTNKVPELMQLYARKLFNWYADNSKYYSGTITINGTAHIEIGKRLMLHSDKDGLYYEFYIESVSHNFSFAQGWTTQIGVTRGIQCSSPSEASTRRFSAPYSFNGQSTVFTGGYFGERTLKDGIEASKKKSSKGSGSSGSPSGKKTKCNGKSGQVIGHWGYESVPDDVKKNIDSACVLSSSDLAKDSVFHGTGLQGQCTHYSHAYMEQKHGGGLASAGNGGQVAQAYISAGKATKVDEPTVGAIFSAQDGHMWGVGSCGHTGVICGTYDDGSFLCIQLNVPPHRATSEQPNVTKIDGVTKGASWYTFALPK